MIEGLYGRVRQEVEEYWDMWVGISTGISFQAIERYPGTVEGITGLEIPGHLFEDTLNEVHADKAIHLATSYGGNRGLVRTIESSPVEPSYPAVWTACQLVTLGLGAYKEFEMDGYPDPLDMLANQVGAHYAARNYRNRFEEDYEVGLETDNLEPEEYLEAPRSND